MPVIPYSFDLFRAGEHYRNVGGKQKRKGRGACTEPGHGLSPRALISRVRADICTVREARSMP